MTPGTIFISHRAEYAKTARGLKDVIESNSAGKIDVFISEDIRGADDWRATLHRHLQNAESLILLYGAPYEDWSWCFYEAGYFTAASCQNAARSIFCIVRPGIPAPSPLSHLQLVTDGDKLIQELIEIYKRTKAPYDAGDLRRDIGGMADDLFGSLTEFVGYPRVTFMVDDSQLRAKKDIPEDAIFASEQSVMNELFRIGKQNVTWKELLEMRTAGGRSAQEQLFVSKWLEETRSIILAGRENVSVAPQAVLIGRAGRRFRFLLTEARIQGDGCFCGEFFAIDDVGGPALGLPSQLLSLLTSVRMGFRFRYEFVQQFAGDVDSLSDEERQNWIAEIPRVINNLTTESQARGDVSLQELLAAFDQDEGDRINRLVRYWPGVKKELYKSLGLAPDGTVVSDQGLRGPNAERFGTAFEVLRLINIEFLSRCCARVSRMMLRSEEDLRKGAEVIERGVRTLAGQTLRPAA